MAPDFLLQEVRLHKNAQAGTLGVKNGSVLTMFPNNLYN